eukprot:CAMPEP_0202882954 /NCGR_PEP_ID=MMETSP1391-20130828/38716_1 /ASSEMBLY_ACC=CAM_ASM_000867 /TAXON_ID=1034604 /ORGANISM="Chlamydomonas leiostraca, Strain SAG 11-49" /LENGTH=72 /DNA_ID=CAMNT_0049565889 /DNA_START=191 /DNA_END=405 /DNA_ORIENTATION=+
MRQRAVHGQAMIAWARYAAARTARFMDHMILGQRAPNSCQWQVPKVLQAGKQQRGQQGSMMQTGTIKGRTIT